MRLRPADERDTTFLALPMTSMIDVVFLLLIFFMVTTNFAEPERELPAALATQGTGGPAPTLEPQVVRVEAGPNGAAVFRIGVHTTGSRDGLTAVLATLPKEPGVIVRVADTAPVWAAAAAMQAVVDAGFEKRTYVPD